VAHGVFIIRRRLEAIGDLCKVLVPHVVTLCRLPVFELAPSRLGSGYVNIDALHSFERDVDDLEGT
jgi:hypothetical protein